MSYTRLTFKQRLKIESGLRAGFSQSAIARRIGVHRSTVCNELSRNGGKDWYSASSAQRSADKKSKRIRMPDGPSVDRFPLSRGGLYRGLYVRPLKRYVRAWRYRIFEPVMRFGQKQYPFKLTWNAKLLRRRYLHYRRRNHGMEGLNRAHRSLEIFQSYKHGFRPRARKWFCHTPYYREYKVSHEGIFKLPYLKRLNPKKNAHRSVWRGYIRFRLQNSVLNRSRTVRETVSPGKPGTSATFSKYKNRKQSLSLSEYFLPVIRKAFSNVWNNAFVASQETYAPLALTTNNTPFRTIQKFNPQKNPAQKIAGAA